MRHQRALDPIESTTDDGTNTTVILTLAEGAKADSNSAVVMSQIVDVYPIGSFTP